EATKGENLIKLPYTVKGNDVAYSGLLKAAATLWRRQGNLDDLCFSLQETAFSMLSEAVERSLVQTRRSEILLAGGVAASQRLRQMIGLVAEDHGASFHPGPIEYSGEWGAQIAYYGGLAYESGITVSTSDSFLTLKWRMDDVDVSWIAGN